MILPRRVRGPLGGWRGVMPNGRPAPARLNGLAMLVTLTALAGMAGVVGCGRVRVVQEAVTPTFDASAIGTLAVAGFENSTRWPGAGRMVGDRVEQMLLREGPYTLVGRQELDRLLLERGLNRAGLIEPRDPAVLAEELRGMVGVDAILVGHVQTFEVKRSSLRMGDPSAAGTTGYDGREPVDLSARVVVTMKLIGVPDGRVLWSRTSRGSAAGTAEVGMRTSGAEQELLEKAIERVADDAREIYPHTRKVLRRIRRE